MYFEISATISGLASACFWAASALVPTPKTITSGYGGTGGSMQDMGDALRKQAKLNAAGAALAAFSIVLSQAPKVMLLTAS